MEGMPKLSRQQMHALVGLSQLQKRTTGFTVRDLTIELNNSSTSSTLMMLRRLEALGVAEKVATSKGVTITRSSYKTDIEAVEHNGTVGLIKMFA